MSDQHHIACRARLEDVGCLHGRPTRAQWDDDVPQRDDGTYDWTSDTIVCDACYAALIPLTPSQQALTHEIDSATEHYRRQLAYIRQADDDALEAELARCRQAIIDARAGSPRWGSANALKAMAERERDRRASQTS